MKKFLNNFSIALQFLTIFCINRGVEIDEEKLGKVSAIFPLIGLLLGLILFISDKFFSLLLPRSIVDILLLLLLIIVTGGLHLDGYADTVDGFAGGRSKEEIIRIMKESNIGTFGVCGIVLLLMLKYLLLNNLLIGIKGAVLLIMPVIGRWAIVHLSFLSEYAGNSRGIGAPFTDFVKGREFWIATFVTGIILISLLGIKGIVIMIFVSVFIFLLNRYSYRKIGGVTGDVLGAVSEISEVLVLLLSIIFFSK
ncbi:MAG: adenosylcobinamide-GDP ribazoletransferase [Nitrospinae bacterium]|nr:adenosylcobinamide-GDP ribazoletransferase [Nitrospinota bacterium]